MLAYLGLGSNMGDRRKFLQDAVLALDEVVDVSSVYETAPIGGPEQGAYLNVVVAIETTKTPRQLLAIARRLEAAAERVRRERWGPRTLDVDVLLVGDLRVDDADLSVPHPRMWERWFVMVPLADVAPQLVAHPPPPEAARSVRDVGPLFPVAAEETYDPYERGQGA